MEDAPDFIDVYLSKAAIFYDQSRYEDAIANFEKALNIDENYYPRAYYQLALTELKVDRYLAAANHLEQFLTHGDRSESLVNRAKGYLADAKICCKSY